MTAVAFGPSSCPSGLTPKSKLLRNPEAQYGFVPTLGALRRLTLQEHSHHGGKNTALRAEKPFPYNAQPFLVERSVTVLLPLKMFNVAKQCVMISWLVRELAHRHKAMRSAQELGELNIERGVFKVFVKSDLPLHI